MQAKTIDSDGYETGVYHDGDEVCIRARSQHSRAKHIPKTDDDGSVVFDEDGNPEPKCGIEPNTDSDWVLRPIRSCDNRDACDKCGNAEAISKKAKANGGTVSWARKMRYGNDWGKSSGDESSSATHSQISSD